MRQAITSVNRGNSSAQARKPTKSELLHSLQLANSYADRIEGEKKSEQKKGTKATKRAAEWKATAEVARMEKRHTINKLKQAEESLSAVEMELKIERERTSDAIAKVVSKVEVCWCCMEVCCHDRLVLFVLVGAMKCDDATKWEDCQCSEIARNAKIVCAMKLLEMRRFSHPGPRGSLAP